MYQPYRIMKRDDNSNYDLIYLKAINNKQYIYNTVIENITCKEACNAANYLNKCARDRGEY